MKVLREGNVSAWYLWIIRDGLWPHYGEHLPPAVIMATAAEPLMAGSSVMTESPSLIINTTIQTQLLWINDFFQEYLRIYLFTNYCKLIRVG